MRQRFGDAPFFSDVQQVCFHLPPLLSADSLRKDVSWFFSAEDSCKCCCTGVGAPQQHALELREMLQLPLNEGTFKPAGPADEKLLLPNVTELDTNLSGLSGENDVNRKTY